MRYSEFELNQDFFGGIAKKVGTYCLLGTVTVLASSMTGLHWVIGMGRDQLTAAQERIQSSLSQKSGLSVEESDKRCESVEPDLAVSVKDITESSVSERQADTDTSETSSAVH